MQPTIYALRAPNNSGKTSAINLLYEIMLEHNFVGHRAKPEKSYEFYAILDWETKRIGITTYGDSPKLIRETLEKMVAKGCHAMVCACHPTEKAEETIESFSDYRIVFVDKTTEEDNRLHHWCNALDAGYLLGRLEELIGK
ncbi:MAG: hypothetical protein IT236_05020 [Bacteroidia bacterium]|nr:hypothetical protein [Bacteroidia bacterium]